MIFIAPRIENSKVGSFTDLVGREWSWTVVAHPPRGEALRSRDFFGGKDEVAAIVEARQIARYQAATGDNFQAMP